MNNTSSGLWARACTVLLVLGAGCAWAGPSAPAAKASEPVAQPVEPVSGASWAASGTELRQLSPKEKAELRDQLRRLSRELLR